MNAASWLLLKNSLLVSGLATALAVLFGFTAALCLAGIGRGWRRLILAAVVLALALPPFLVTNSWLHFLGHTGTWRAWLNFDIFSLGGAVWILSLLLWPLPLLAVLSAWQRLEPAQLESDMAVTGGALLRVLLWPLARTALGQGAVLVFVLAFNNFAVPAILQLKVFPAEVWIRFNTTFDTPGALRLSWPMLLAPVFLLLWFSRRKFPWPHIESTVSPQLFRQQLGPRWFWSCAAVTGLLCGVSVVLPLLQILTVKRTWTELSGALEAGQNAVWSSFWFSAVAATLVLVLGLLAIGGWRPATDSKRLLTFRDLFGVALWLPFLVPGVLLGIALITLFNRPWSALFYESAGIVILAFVVRYLALGWNTIAHAAQTVDPALRDAAWLDGVSRWQMLRHVYWPQIASQAGAAWYIIFLLCLWDVESMLLVVPPGGETLALRIFNLLHYGHNAQVNALCLILLVVALVPLLGWSAWNLLRLEFTLRGKRALALAPLLISGLVLSSCGRSGQGLHSQLFAEVKIIGTRGVGVGQLNKPRSVAVDLQDNVYAVDMTGRVQKFSPQGQFLLLWQMPQTDLGKPKGMGRDRQGNIIVVEPHYQRINDYSPEGKLLFQFGQKGTNAGQFIMPRAVAVNSHNEIFVSEYGAVERVQKFKLRGADNATGPAMQFLTSFGYAGTGPGEFNRPEGLCMDAQDRLYVADSCNHRIQIFTSDGKFLRAYGKAGKGLGELSYPYDICVDAAGRQYVCEFGNSRIQVFDAHDHPIEIIGGPGAEPGRFSNPWGVALDSAENLYVADSQNHRLQELLRAHGSVAAGIPPASAAASGRGFSWVHGTAWPWLRR